jgi:hypothetical protein
MVIVSMPFESNAGVAPSSAEERPSMRNRLLALANGLQETAGCGAHQVSPDLVLRADLSVGQAQGAPGALSRRSCQNALLLPDQRSFGGLARTQHSY